MMQMKTLIASLTGLCSLMLLTACVGSGGPNISEYTTSCMFEVNAKGAYVWSDGDAEVKAQGGGNPAEEAAMNDCIRRKAAAAGDDLTTPAPRGVTEVQAVDGRVVETFTYGTPPAAAPSAPAMSGATGENCRNRNVLSGGSGYYGCTR